MSVHLTSGQLCRIRELQELLLTPLRSPTPQEWIEGVHEGMLDLFGVERSFLVMPRAPDDVLIDSPNMDPTILQRLRNAIVGLEPGGNRYGDPALDRSMRRLAVAGVEIWDREIGERVSRIELEAMPRFYPEVVRPGRLKSMLMMGASLPKGRAMLGIFPDEGEDTAFDEPVEVCRLLLPAFKAGSRMRAMANHRWRRLRETLDRLEEGVAVYRGGEEQYRNRALRKLLESDERREAVIAGIDRCARKLVRALGSRGPSEALREISTEVRTARNRYRLAANHLDGGSDGEPVTAMVVVRPAIPLLPDEAALRERYDLTARQAEVAILLARGRSNREIADELVISRHTARHHAQRALEKIGAESRKALALHLLADRRL